MAIEFANSCQFPQDLDNALKDLEQEIGDRIIANKVLLDQAIASIGNLPALIDQGLETLNQIYALGNPPPEARPSTEVASLAGSAVVTTAGNQAQITPTDSPNPSAANQEAGGIPDVYDTSSSIRSTNDVSEQFGILPDPSNEQEDEKWIANGGFQLIDGVLYLSTSNNPADLNNVENLRRLYLAVGKDLDAADALLKAGGKAAFVNSDLTIKSVPPKQLGREAFSLEEIKELLKENQLKKDDVTVLSDFSSLVLLKTYFSTNKKKSEIQRIKGITALERDQILTDVFHFDTIDNSTGAIDRYRDYGYKDAELSAILAGIDMIDTTTNPIDTLIGSNRNTASETLAKVTFARERIKIPGAFTFQSRKSFQSDIANSAVQLLSGHTTIFTNFFFTVTVITQTDILDKLREKHSDTVIKRLLEERPEIKSVVFDPSDDILLRSINSNLNAAPPGSTSVSNKAVNLPKRTTYSRAILLSMYADLIEARNANLISLSGITSNTLGNLAQALINYGARSPVAEVFIKDDTLVQPPPFKAPTSSEEIIQGEPNYTSPSVILAERFNPVNTMNYNNRLNEVTTAFESVRGLYPSAIAEPLIAIISGITNLLSQALKGCQNLLDLGSNELFGVKKKLDSFMSQVDSAIGKGNFDTSLLKCAVNFDLGIGGLANNLLGALGDILNNIAVLGAGFLGALGGWLADIATQILCVPLNLIDSFLGKAAAALPSACQIPRFDFGDDMNLALEGLGNVGNAKTAVLRGTRRDIIKFKVSLLAAPERLNQFQTSSACNTDKVGSFMNAALLNVGLPTPPTPPSVPNTASSARALTGGLL